MNLPLNCLLCSCCHCFRSISEYSFHDDGLHLITCIYCQFTRKRQSQQRLQTQQLSSQQTQQILAQYTLPRYCSSCNQLRQPSQFSQFKTCEICRTTNKKAQLRRTQEGRLHRQRHRMQRAERHLQQWVQLAGEEEVHAASMKSKGFKLHSWFKKQPLTIDDYLQEEEPEKLKQWLEKQQQRKQKKEKPQQL